MKGAVEMELQPKADTPAALPATVTVSSDTMAIMQLIERMSLDERIDPSKMREIFGLKRDLDADKAKREFQVAFAEMTEELPVITKTGQIKNSKGTVQSKYARYEDIQRVVKPILRKYGFTLNHEQSPDTSAEMVLTTCLIHRGGHSQRSTFRAKADNSGSKNDVQGLGSIASYAKRYNVTALLDLETQGEDDDAQKATMLNRPAGFAEWFAEMQDASMLGMKALTAKWQSSPKAFTDVIFAKDWGSLKAAAASADKAGSNA